MKGVRQKEGQFEISLIVVDNTERDSLLIDPWNAIISGFMTGGCLAARGALESYARKI